MLSLTLSFICILISIISVVTVDGILLTKSGTMTGGTSGGMEAKSNKWDDKKIEGWFVTSWFRVFSLPMYCLRAKIWVVQD